MNPQIINLTQESFSDVVIEGSNQNYVVVNFCAPAYQPCEQLMPLLEKLSGEFGYLLANVNNEEEPQLAQNYGIHAIPDVRIYKDGAVVEQFTGLLSEQELQEIFGRYMTGAPSAIENLIDQIHQQAAAGETEQATIAFGQLLEENPDSSEVKIAYAKLMMELGDQEQAITLLGEIKQTDALYSTAQSILALGQFQQDCRALDKMEPGEGSARTYAEGACAVINSDPQAALEKFLTIVKQDRNFNDDAARKAILKVFELIGEHPIVRQYQRKLAILLN